jgi:hypothetical protein
MRELTGTTSKQNQPRAHTSDPHEDDATVFNDGVMCSTTA